MGKQWKTNEAHQKGLCNQRGRVGGRPRLEQLRHWLLSMMRRGRVSPRFP